MNLIRSSAFVALAALSASAMASSQLIISDEAAKDGRGGVVGLDVALDANAVAFQARFTVPAGAKLDLSKCLSGIPRSHTGTCVSPVPGEVLVLVYSGTNATFGSNLFSIGQVTYRGASGKGSFEMSEFLVSDASGNALDVQTK